MNIESKNVVVIGNGCAGAECIKALRGNGFRGEIALMTDSKWPTYNPMLTTYFAAGKIGFKGLFPFGAAKAFCEKYRVDLHTASPVIALDAERRLAASQSGLELPYDQCLIATGAAAVVPPLEGIASAKVHVMRTVEDAIALKRAMKKKPKRALVVGASMVGIKLVELFRAAGMEVCLADLSTHIFPLAAHPDCAALIEERLRQQGITLRFGAGIQKLQETATGIRAFFQDSAEAEEADLALLCIGVRANTAFIDRGQVAVERGVLVDERMQTSAPGLYAAGDVAQGRNILTGGRQIIGLWANARYQGRTAGRNMAGRTDAYPGNILHNITHFMGMDFVGIGDVLEFDHMEKRDDGKTFTQLFWRNGLLTGANFVDRFLESGVLRNALMKGLTRQGTILAPGNPPVAYNLLIKQILTEVQSS